MNNDRFPFGIIFAIAIPAGILLGLFWTAVGR